MRPAAVFAFVLLVAPVIASAEETVRPLVISTLPFDDANAQRALFNTLSAHLSRSLGQPVRFEVGKSYDDVIAQLSAGKVDVGFVGAGSYVLARRKGDVRAILRAIRKRSSSYQGVIITKTDSDVRSLEDLRGKTFAFVHPNSTAGYFYARDALKRAGVDANRDLEAVFAGGHHTVVQMVARGEVAAGACFEGAEQNLQDPSVLRTLGRTAPIPGDPVVVRPGLGKDLVGRLRSALIELALLPEARTFFTFSEIDGFEPAVDRDYDAVAEVIRAGES